MSRGDRGAAVAAALALGGCMRIYPDPELPDVVVEWFPEGDCVEDSDRVIATLSTIDPAAEVGTVTAPCRDGSLRFDDVARVRYQLVARLEDTSGAVYGGQDAEIDLRDGVSERVFTFFGRAPGSNFRVRWAFDVGASCASLNATWVVLEVEAPGGGPFFPYTVPCDAAILVNAIPVEGTYTITAHAIAIDEPVATSPASAPFTIRHGTITDLGTLTLTPCGTSCPPIGLE